MKLYLKSSRKNYDAIGEYDVASKKFVVKKGSKVSDDVAVSSTFKGTKTIEKNRENVIKNNVVIKDCIFKSSSTAANFVTGRSTNGLISWKDENGTKLKDLIK